MTSVEGRVPFARLLYRHGLPLVLTAAAPIVAAYSMWADFQAKYIAAGFALLTGTASLCYALVDSASVVTWFALAGDEFSFSRFARARRIASLADVLWVSDIDATSNWATIWLRDGTSLKVHLAHLPNARALVDACAAAVPIRKPSSGCLNGSAVAGKLIRQVLYTCLLATLAALGLLLLAVGLHPARMLNQWIFLALAGVFSALAAAGMYFLVLRYWIGCVRWFELDDENLRYRTVLSRRICARRTSDVATVIVHRPDSPQAEAGTWVAVRFRNGGWFKLQPGVLQNAAALHEALRTEILRRASRGTSGEPTLTAKAGPLWPFVEPHLADGERVYWFGAPRCRKLWSEIAASVLFGVLLCIPSVVGLWVFFRVALPRGEWAALVIVAVTAIFAAIGVALIASPWRFRRMLHGVAYAVTSDRALVVCPLSWGTRVEVARTGEPVESFSLEQLREYQTVSKGRDIAIGGEWKRGRRSARHWAHHGFLAPDDPLAAEAAILRLIAGSDTERILGA